MSQLTKKAIIDCTVALAARKPLNRITVRDIVEACGITRNTFYYYFHDIYDVLDEIIEQKLNEIEAQNYRDVEARLFDFFEFCIAYKKVWFNLYKAVGRDQLSRYLSTRIRQVIRGFFDAEPEGKNLDPRDFDLISAFYEEAIVGVMIRWLKNDSPYSTPEELKAEVDRIRVLFDGQIRLILENSRKKEEIYRK